MCVSGGPCKKLQWATNFFQKVIKFGTVFDIGYSEQQTSNIMECINKIELQGTVGNVNINKVGDTSVARFSVCTEYCYKSTDGSIVIDCTWHNCTAWESSKNKIADIAKGKAVHLTGRLRNYRFMNADGSERTGSEIFVNEVHTI